VRGALACMLTPSLHVDARASGHGGKGLGLGWAGVVGDTSKSWSRAPHLPPHLSPPMPLSHAIQCANQSTHPNAAAGAWPTSVADTGKASPEEAELRLRSQLMSMYYQVSGRGGGFWWSAEGA